MAPTTTWTRVARRLGKNPLRRRLDLIDGWLVPTVIAAFVVLGPLLAGGVGLWIHADNAAAQRAERSWHEVRAVLLQPVPGPALAGGNGSNSWLVWAPARWTADGRTHAGNVPVPAGTRQDAVVPVWLSRAGHVQSPPLSAEAARDRIAVAAVFALASLAALLAILVAVTRWLLDRKRLAGWEAAWRSVGPQWSDWRNRSGS